MVTSSNVLNRNDVKQLEERLVVLLSFIEIVLVTLLVNENRNRDV